MMLFYPLKHRLTSLALFGALLLGSNHLPPEWSGIGQFLSSAYAQPQSTQISPVTGVDKIFPAAVNWTGADFLSAYSQPLGSTARQFAAMYLWGVLDATEGSQWCSYQIIKSISLEEAVLAKMSRLPKEELSKRASALILATFPKSTDCKRVRQ